MENSQGKGYISEKLIHGFLGGCLHIYHGTEEVFEIFNPKSFIFYDIHNRQPALNEFAHLQRKDTAYQERMDTPILRNGAQTIEEFFSLADDLGNGTLKPKIRTMLRFSAMYDDKPAHSHAAHFADCKCRNGVLPLGMLARHSIVFPAPVTNASTFPHKSPRYNSVSADDNPGWCLLLGQQGRHPKRTQSNSSNIA